MAEVINIAGAWFILSILTFAVGVKVLNANAKSLCPCGKDFVPKSETLSNFFTKLGRRIEHKKGFWNGVESTLAVLFAIQLLPPLFTFELGWRFVKKLHGRHCLAYQLSRTEIES